jgi:phage replication-related protein YjqB (UPF0714/DUF867 family)
MDLYTSFEKLKDSERRNMDYRIRRRLGHTGIAILSIHGGEIEPGTTRIADAIAGHDHSFYSFEGIKRRGNLNLHITSTRFDEPTAIEIVCHCAIIISIHGCADTEAVVHLGGLDFELRDRILESLHSSDFKALASSEAPFGGIDQANICNLCGRGMGVQMEISRGLRAKMFRDLSPEGRRYRTPLFDRFTRAVRHAIAPFAMSFTPPEPLQGTD